MKILIVEDEIDLSKSITEYLRKSIETAKQHLRKWNKDNDIIVLDQSSATVELAADALGVTCSEIATSVSFYDKNGGIILIVICGTARIDGRKFKR